MDFTFLKAKRIIEPVLSIAFIVMVSTACFASDDNPYMNLVNTYTENEEFSGAVLVAKDDEIVFKQAFGLAEQSSQRPNSEDTQFLIGSLTKSFSAVATMKLVEADMIALHAPLASYLPGLRSDLAKGLTLHHLLKHQSGLPVHLERLASFEDKDVTSAEILSIINTADTDFEPGQQYRYSNLNYHLTALVLEQVTGMSYAALMQRYVFKPLGMHSSGVERKAKPAPNLAQGYRERFLITQPVNNIVSYALGSGDIYSTLDDLYAFSQALEKGSYLSENSRRLLFDGESAQWGSYGYGFRIVPYQRSDTNPTASPGTLIRHGGSMDGFISNMHMYLDDNITVIVLTNIRPFPIRQLTFELKEIALGISPSARSRQWTHGAE